MKAENKGQWKSSIIIALMASVVIQFGILEPLYSIDPITLKVESATGSTTVTETLTKQPQLPAMPVTVVGASFSSSISAVLPTPSSVAMTAGSHTGGSSPTTGTAATATKYLEIISKGDATDDQAILWIGAGTHSGFPGTGIPVIKYGSTGIMEVPLNFNYSVSCATGSTIGYTVVEYKYNE